MAGGRGSCSRGHQIDLPGEVMLSTDSHICKSSCTPLTKDSIERAAGRPPMHDIYFSAMPQQLQICPRFVLWQWQWQCRQKRWTKVPFRLSWEKRRNADGTTKTVQCLGPASSTDPTTWGDFESV